MAKWSDYGLSYVSESNKPTTADILSSLLGSNDSVLTFDTFKQLSDSIDNEIKSRNDLFSGLQSNEDLLSAAKNYNKLDTINQKVYSSDLLQGDWINRLVSPILKGVSAGSSIAGWKGMLAGLFGGAGAGVSNVFTQEKRAEEQAKEIEKIRNDINSKIENQTEYEQYLFDTSKQNIASNMNRQAWANMAAFGGPLHSYGADWRNGLVEINNGGSHEANPFEGVQYGIAQDGQPNLVEEGEVVWNDYVFSNRINAPEDIKKQYKLGGKMNTFADIARYMKEMYDERPNDPIAKRTLEDFMSKLAQSQEVERQKAAEQQAFEAYENLASLYADGGPIHIAKNKRGTFTAAATKHNMGVQEFASHVLANKDNFSPAMVKKANFAKNASKWKHALGGHLFDLGGPDGDIFNGLYWHYDPELANNYVTQSYTPSTIVNIPMLGEKRTEPELLTTSEYLPNMGTEITAAPTAASTYKWDLDEAINNPIQTNPKAPKTKSKTNGWNAAGMAMRLAAALGPAFGALSAAWSKPDYKWAEDLVEGVNKLTKNMSGVSYKPTARYLPYSPMDKAYYMNQLMSEMAARRRADIELSGGNRATALANSKASDIAQQKAIGEVTKAAEDFNRKELERVVSHNMKGDQFDSQMSLEAQKANASINEAKARMQLQALMQALGWNRQDDMYHSATLAQNLTQLFDNIGGIGTEIMNREQQKALMDSGVWGTLTEMLRRNGFMD